MYQHENVPCHHVKLAFDDYCNKRNGVWNIWVPAVLVVLLLTMIHSPPLTPKPSSPWLSPAWVSTLVSQSMLSAPLQANKSFISFISTKPRQFFARLKISFPKSVFSWIAPLIFNRRDCSIKYHRWTGQLGNSSSLWVSQKMQRFIFLWKGSFDWSVGGLKTHRGRFSWHGIPIFIFPGWKRFWFSLFRHLITHTQSNANYWNFYR